jgi:hypothetical protein
MAPMWETHVSLVVCRAAVSMSGEAQWPSHRATSVGTQLTLCALMFEIDRNFPSPRWEMPADMPKSILIFQLGSIFFLPGTSTFQSRLQNFPSPRWEIADGIFTCFALVQGGGVNVGGGTVVSVAISSCTISGNTATFVRADVRNFPSP